MSPLKVEYAKRPEWKDGPPEGYSNEDPSDSSSITYILSVGAEIQGKLHGRDVTVTSTEQGFNVHYANQPADIPDIVYSYKDHDWIPLNNGDKVFAIQPLKEEPHEEPQE